MTFQGAEEKRMPGPGRRVMRGFPSAILRGRRKAHGFTLIEIMIAIMLLVIALMGITSVTVTVFKGNDLSKIVTTSATVAQDKMEELKNGTTSVAGYNALANGSDTVDAVYVREWTVGAVGTTAPYNDTTKMKKITVMVTRTWNGQPHTVTLNTIISRPH